MLKYISMTFSVGFVLSSAFAETWEADMEIEDSSGFLRSLIARAPSSKGIVRTILDSELEPKASENGWYQLKEQIKPRLFRNLDGTMYRITHLLPARLRSLTEQTYDFNLATDPGSDKTLPLFLKGVKPAEILDSLSGSVLLPPSLSVFYPSKYSKVNGVTNKIRRLPSTRRGTPRYYLTVPVENRRASEGEVRWSMARVPDHRDCFSYICEGEEKYIFKAPSVSVTFAMELWDDVKDNYSSTKLVEEGRDATLDFESTDSSEESLSTTFGSYTSDLTDHGVIFPVIDSEVGNTLSGSGTEKPSELKKAVAKTSPLPIRDSAEQTEDFKESTSLEGSRGGKSGVVDAPEKENVALNSSGITHESETDYVVLTSHEVEKAPECRISPEKHGIVARFMMDWHSKDRYPDQTARYGQIRGKIADFLGVNAAEAKRLHLLALEKERLGVTSEASAMRDSELLRLDPTDIEENLSLVAAALLPLVGRNNLLAAADLIHQVYNISHFQALALFRMHTELDGESLYRQLAFEFFRANQNHYGKPDGGALGEIGDLFGIPPEVADQLFSKYWIEYLRQLKKRAKSSEEKEELQTSGVLVDLPPVPFNPVNPPLYVAEFAQRVNGLGILKDKAPLKSYQLSLEVTKPVHVANILTSVFRVPWMQAFALARQNQTGKSGCVYSETVQELIRLRDQYDVENGEVDPLMIAALQEIFGFDESVAAEVYARYREDLPVKTEGFQYEAEGLWAPTGTATLPEACSQVLGALHHFSDHLRTLHRGTSDPVLKRFTYPLQRIFHLKWYAAFQLVEKK